VVLVLVLVVVLVVVVVVDRHGAGGWLGIRGGLRNRFVVHAGRAFRMSTQPHSRCFGPKRAWLGSLRPRPVPTLFTLALPCRPALCRQSLTSKGIDRAPDWQDQVAPSPM
jgi:hypothetical protein